MTGPKSEQSEARPTSAAALLERARGAWPRFVGGVHQVGRRHLDEPTPAGWRYRDLAAHAAVWHRIAARGIRAVHETGELPDEELGSTDEINARAARDADGVAPDTLLADLDASWEELGSVLAALRDQDLVPHDGWVVQVTAENTWEHYDEHRPELLAARPASADAFLARFDEDWGAFRAMLDRLRDVAPDATKGTGWRYPQLVAHAVGWLDDAVTRLPEIRADPQVLFRQPVDIDAFNARSVEARAGRTGPELLRELDDAERRFREAVSGLDPDAFSGGPVLMFLATRSYMHADEHLAELEALAGD